MTINNHDEMREKPKQYRAGTLVYSRMGLLAVCSWLLWGDFVFQLMDVVASSFIPLKLKYLDAPNWLLGLFVTTVPSLVGITVAPAISVASDRTRSRMGRRIPYLIYGTPFMTLFLLMLGFSDELAAWLQTILFVNSTPTQVALWLAGALVVGFQFFNIYITNIYYCLFNDVIPPEFLSRFLALFRVVTILATAGFQYFLFGLAETHMKEIFVGSSLLNGLVFLLMCIFVKEGTYPPPPERTEKKSGLIYHIRTYLRECFTNRLYWYFFLANTFWGISLAVVSFRVFFAQSVGISLEQFGKLMGVVGITSAILLYPAAALADRWHPLRVMILGMSLLLLVVPLQLVFVFMDVPLELSSKIYAGLFTLHIVVQVLFNAAQMPMFMRILPHERFAQFNSANGVIFSLAMILAGALSGAWLDWLDARTADPLYHYRYLPAWVSSCLALCLVFLILLYKEWKKYGGDKNYEPPQ